MDRQKEIEKLYEEFESFRIAFTAIADRIKEIASRSESTPEPKEPETWKEIDDNTKDQFFEWAWNFVSKEKADEVERFAKRLLIADYCGRREFVKDEENWHVYKDMDEKEWVIGPATSFMDAEANYFPTKEAAEKYLKICQNSGLL